MTWMKPLWWVFLPCIPMMLQAQEQTPAIEDTWERLSERSGMTTNEDDGMDQALRHLRLYPLDINTASREDWQTLYWITDLQVGQLMQYRRVFGDLVSLYELQAVPGWEPETIRKSIPFLKVGTDRLSRIDWKKGLKAGQFSCLALFSAKAGKNKSYLGDPFRLSLKFRYNYRNMLQYGITADKDAGEPFFTGAQKAGFDFYSFHVYARKWKGIDALALGDFTINMGQGLIQWQSLAFGKSSQIIPIKRQSPVLRPYRSSGESFFFRGTGITIRRKKISMTGFASLRQLGARVVFDSLSGNRHITSFDYSGYHRTVSEIRTRNAVKQFSTGANISYRGEKGNIGVNFIEHVFSLPVQKRNEPYLRYAWSGRRWWNASLDYSFTHHNMHLFGEAALDKKAKVATVQGMLIQVDPKIELSLLYRYLDRKYQAVYGDAFTESNQPTNETGFYAGLVFRPAAAWTMGMYADLFRFPWLRFGVNAPSYGREYLIRGSYQPGRQLEIYATYKFESKQKNNAVDIVRTPVAEFFTKQQWRVHIAAKLTTRLEWRARTEIIYYQDAAIKLQQGFLAYTDIHYRMQAKPLSIDIRWQYFDAPVYQVRVYAYENDVAMTYSVPTFYGVGQRYYVNTRLDLSNRVSVWLKWAQIFFKDFRVSASGTVVNDLLSKWELNCSIRVVSKRTMD